MAKSYLTSLIYLEIGQVSSQSPPGFAHPEDRVSIDLTESVEGRPDDVTSDKEMGPGVMVSRNLGHPQFMAIL